MSLDACMKPTGISGDRRRAPPCGSVRRVPMSIASTVGKRARYNSNASRIFSAPSTDASPNPVGVETRGGWVQVKIDRS
jgi:hypothetical protein